MPDGSEVSAASDASTARAGGAVRRLVIVESPAKAKTIKGYLGPGYTVEASVGHIRDLPTRAADIPAAQKGQPWARLGVNVDSQFEPLYVVDADKRSKVAELKRELKNADELLLATDEDREGEAIAWHLLEVLKPTVPVRRMVFHEITRDAIRAAAQDTRELDLRLVDAQETRRIIDRLYGYEVSPVLWKKVMQGLSAGRVQSVATRLVVERERERIAFVDASYWDLEARLDPGAFTARLVELAGDRVATGRDFGADGRLRTRGAVALDEAAARDLASALAESSFAVRTVEEKAYRRSPAAPFMTSTLQQEASRKLRFSSQTTMRVAQRLYENGYITYMRTDSTTLSASAIAAARATAREIFGAEHVADAPRQYNRKVKNAQEAHEAIRPSGDAFRTPGEVGPELSSDELALYDLIWKRTVASQMSDARGSTVTVRLGATAADGRDAVFSVSGTVITHRGFLAAYEEGRDDDGSSNGEGGEAADGGERRLPLLKSGDPLSLLGLDAQGHSTQPPPRYTEATLVKALEERGIGRPSTYASIMGTILDRGYVWKRGGALVPSFLAFAVVSLLEKHFGELVDYDFTARMEEVLDLVADGQAQRLDTLRRFYFGEDGPAGGSVAQVAGRPTGPDGDESFRGLHPMVGDLGEIDAREINSIPVGAGIVLRVGRYGPYLERESVGPDGAVTTERAPVADDIAPDELTVARAEELLSRPSGDRELGTDPQTGRTRRGEGRPVRAVRDRGAAGRRPQERQAADRVAVQDHERRHGHDRRGGTAAVAAAHGRRRPRRRCRDHGPERPVRPLPEEGHRLALAAVRGGPVRGRAGAGAGDLRRTQAAGPRSRGGATPARARRGPRHRSDARGAGGPLRGVRHRRGDQRDAAQGRRGRVAHGRARRRAAGRQARQGPGPEEACGEAPILTSPVVRGDRQPGGLRRPGGPVGTANMASDAAGTHQPASTPVAMRRYGTASMSTRWSTVTVALARESRPAWSASGLRESVPAAPRSGLRR